jgi:ATP-dependent helicase/nuclease subunit A
VDEAMAWAADEAGVVGLYALLGERGLRSTLEALVRQRLDVEAALAGLPDDVLAHWQGALRKEQGRCLAGLLNSAAWGEAVAVLRDNQATRADDRMEIQRQEALAALESEAGSVAEQVEALSCLDAINLRFGSQKSWPGGKEQLTEVKDALRSLRALWRDQASLLTLALGPQDEALAQALPAVRRLFEQAAGVYRRLKEERQALDFDDLESWALVLFQENEEVRARWRSEIQAILVDEFQDTNGRQRDLVTLLNDGGRLFIVGDAKQSIYRFRGADVAVYRQERRRITGEGGKHFPLETSYRAHKALVQGLNDLVRPVLGEEEDPNRPWVEPFAPLAPHRSQAGAGFAAPHIELHLTAGTKGSGALARAADALAGRISDLLAGEIVIYRDGQREALKHDDIAILCRASTSFGAYEDALERAGIPFLTVSGRGFYERPEIRDLLNALQALADPTDDLVLVGLLRSPALALSDVGLYRLCTARDEGGGSSTLWDVVRATPGVLSGEDKARARRAAHLVVQLHGRVGRTGVADVLKGFLDATNYRAALVQADQVRGARNVSKLLADAHASGIVGVGEFLEYVTGLRDSGAREGEARSTAEGAVRIMTIHAAKGLEFAVVAIGDVTSGGGGPRWSPPLIDAALGPLLKLEDEEGDGPAIYQLGKVRSEDQEAAESDRLLYVAATRAREKLILSGCLHLNQGNVVGREGGYLGRLAEPDCLGLRGMTIPHDEEGAEAKEIPLKVGTTAVACVVYEPGYVWDRHAPTAEAVAEQACPAPPPLLAPVSSPRVGIDERTAEQERVPRQRVWRVVPPVKRPRAPAWVVGSLVHEALAAWRFPGAPGPDFVRWGEARARGYGITDARQLADAVRRTRQLLDGFRRQPLFEEMDGADVRLHEVPYSLTVDGRVERGIMDAVYQREGRWTIVEFKTDEVRDGAGLERLLAKEDYLAQAGRYVHAAERLLGQAPRMVLCMLNFARSVQLYEVHPAGRGAASSGSTRGTVLAQLDNLAAR